MVQVATLILALLACTKVTAEGPTICDNAKCGKGTCRETPGLIPLTTSYNCTCDPGWTKPKLFNVTVPFAPCFIPDCPFDPLSCFNISLLPKAIPLTWDDPCMAINCGPGGECKKGDGFTYSCECQPGYANFLNFTVLPCVKNCVFGTDCSRLGIAPPPPPPSTAPPPPGSAPSRHPLQLLWLLSFAMVQLV